MRICFVVPAVYPLFNTDVKTKRRFGGAEKQISILTRELALDKNNIITCCVADFGQTKDIDIIDNVTFYKSFSYEESKISGFIKLYRTLKKIDADNYVFFTADAGVAAGIFIVKQLLKKKVLYMIAHDAECSFSGLLKMNGFATALSMKFAYKWCDIVIAQTALQSSVFAKKRGVQPDSVLECIIENDYFEDGLDRDQVLWIGRCEPWKRPELFLELVKKYQDEKFTMIAPKVPGKEKFFLKIQEMASKLSNLEFIEFVPSGKIKHFYKKSKIFVITSEFEGFPNTIMEAMVNKTPILSLSINPDDIFSSGENGFFCDNDMDLFYSNFENLINSKDLRDCITVNAGKHINNNHNKTNIAKKFLHLLK